MQCSIKKQLHLASNNIVFVLANNKNFFIHRTFAYMCTSCYLIPNKNEGMCYIGQIVLISVIIEERSTKNDFEIHTLSSSSSSLCLKGNSADFTLLKTAKISCCLWFLVPSGMFDLLNRISNLILTLSAQKKAIMICDRNTILYHEQKLGGYHNYTPEPGCWYPPWPTAYGLGQHPGSGV